MGSGCAKGSIYMDSARRLLAFTLFLVGSVPMSQPLFVNKYFWKSISGVKKYFVMFLSDIRKENGNFS